MYSDAKKALHVRACKLVKPADRAELKRWLEAFLNMTVPEKGVCEGHCSPLDYLEHVFFEKGGDVVVWACRGGGKTKIGAVATLLDMLFKPGIEVRILAGSEEQSMKMYGYLCGFVMKGFTEELAGKMTRKGFAMKNGSKVEILTQSEMSVRGTRVQKMRCDEVELFSEEVWRAAQLTTRSREGARGTVEVFSTMHVVGGIMAGLVEDVEGKMQGANREICVPGGGQDARVTRKVFKWCVWDVAEECRESERKCEGCRLWESCGGKARKGAGYVGMVDVFAMYDRSSRRDWESEMLCRAPYNEHAVYGGFGAERHVRGLEGVPGAGSVVEIEGVGRWRMEHVVCGVDFGMRKFACVWMAMMRTMRGERAAWVLDEYVGEEMMLERNLGVVRARGWEVLAYYVDVAGMQRESQSGRSSIGVMRGEGMEVKAKTMGVEDGIGRICGMLGEKGVLDVPRLLVHPRCRGVILGMQSYARGKDGEVVKDGVHDHLMDAMRYGLVGHDGVYGKVEVRGY